MTYPEPKNLDEQFGVGAEKADAIAAHDEEMALEILAEFGVDAYNLGDQQIDTIYEIIFEALARGRKEGREEVEERYAAAHDCNHTGHGE